MGLTVACTLTGLFQLHRKSCLNESTALLELGNYRLSRARGDVAAEWSPDTCWLWNRGKKGQILLQSQGNLQLSGVMMISALWNCHPCRPKAVIVLKRIYGVINYCFANNIGSCAWFSTYLSFLPIPIISIVMTTLCVVLNLADVCVLLPFYLAEKNSLRFFTVPKFDSRFQLYPLLTLAKVWPCSAAIFKWSICGLLVHQRFDSSSLYFNHMPFSS